MMRVRLTKVFQIAGLHYRPGEIINAAPELARKLIEDGMAVPIDE